MTLTYTHESYESGPLSTTTEYKLSDGSRWVRIVEEYIAPDMKARKRTRVLRSDFPGDKEHRSTLRELEGVIANASLHIYLYTPTAPASRDEKRAAAIETAKAEDAEQTAPGPLSYVKTTKWMGTDPEEDLYTNVYTYAFNDGMTYVKREAKDIVLGGFTNTVHQTGPDGRTVKSTLRELNQRVEQADAAARAEEKAQRAASAPAPKPRPAYVIEPGYEERALPLTARQEAVVAAIHKELDLRYPLDVLPPVRGNEDLTASADSPSGRVFMEIDPEGYVQRVAARYEFAGFVGWATLDSADSDLALRVKEIARAARLATPVITAGTNAAE
jgi:hypothetical protein